MNLFVVIYLLVEYDELSTWEKWYLSGGIFINRIL